MAASPSPTSSGSGSQRPDAVALGTVIEERYRVDAVLGAGGMGRVYRGEHLGIGRPVAIKVLHADLNRNRDAAARFQREAIASGRLDHPNIVNVSDFGVLDDGAPYMVMEVLEGEPLGDRLQREKHVPWREALEIVRGVLCGLSHAHERGVVHRDIKPDNVFLTRKDGELTVKILDFGIAKLYAGDADDPASTRAGLTVGTPAYLSPEQAVGGEITPASDLYSVSVVLFEMLAGRAPFEDKDPLAMLGAHVSRPPPQVGELAPGIELPFGLEEIVQLGLAKSPSERIKSAVDYLGYVDAILSAPHGKGSPELARELLALIPAAPPPPPPRKPRAPSVSQPTDLADISDQSILLAVDQLASLPPPARPAAPQPPVVAPAPTPRKTSPPASLNDQSVMITVEPYRPPEPSSGMPPAARVVALGEGDAIPRRWLAIAAAVVGAIAVLAIALAIAKRGGPAAPPPPALAPAVDPEMRLKALLHDLQNGKTCEERRATIAKLVEYRDPRVVDALKKARYRMTGGVLGIGASNSNACLTKDAVAALRTLGAIK